jgi:Asp-tRNA(Asn)/Glu-tRNA(Gln) amidotransferase B subunit
MPQSKGITMPACKYIYKKLVDYYEKNNQICPTDVEDFAEAEGLWAVDEWGHVGACIVTCLDNKKLVNQYKLGQVKVLDTLVGKTIKQAFMTVDGELIKELMPLIINHYSWD